MRSSFCGVVALGLVISACGNTALRAAEDGDFARLKSEIASKHQSGRMSNGEAADLARAVATRELVSARDEKQATERLHETRACAGDLDDALAERMKKHDGPGAEAGLERFEAGKLSRGDARAFLDDADDRWRAIGTRTLTKDDDGKRRRDAMLDPSPRVRRSAIRAASETRDPADLDVLFETARVDPELLLRNEALRAMSAIVRGDAGKGRAAELVTRLRDLQTTGDDAVREDIAVAFALSPVFEAGGREALRVEIASGHGPGAIAAAGVVLRTQAKDAELTQSASALISRTIAEGPRRDRLHALAIAKPAGTVLGALREAAKNDVDDDIKVGALARLLDSAPDRDASVRALEVFAGYGLKAEEDDGHARELAGRARYALATAGDLRIQAWIEQDLAAPGAERRLGAASALAALGRSARAAPLLADGDASVRTRAACTLLVAARR